jgi:hypothetical protein
MIRLARISAAVVLVALAMTLAHVPFHGYARPTRVRETSIVGPGGERIAGLFAGMAAHRINDAARFKKPAPGPAQCGSRVASGLLGKILALVETKAQAQGGGPPYIGPCLSSSSSNQSAEGSCGNGCTQDIVTSGGPSTYGHYIDGTNVCCATCTSSGSNCGASACRFSCTEDSQCATPGTNGPYCINGTCQGCGGNGDCTAARGGGFCHSGTCGCLNSDCPISGTTPICGDHGFGARRE